MTPEQREHYTQFFKTHGRDLQQAIEDGFATYQRYPEEFRLDHSGGVKCQIVRGHIIAQVKARFPQGAGITWIESGELFRLNIGQDVNLQFKKMDSRHQVSQILTQQAAAYKAQEQTEAFPPGLNFFVGYVPNETFTAIEDIFVTCPQEFRTQFSMSLREAMPNAMIIPMEFGVHQEPSLDGVIKKVDDGKGEKDAGIENQA